MKSYPGEKSKRRTPRRPQDAKAASARQKYEHFLALARAEDGNGDRVAAQNYYQHAEHYLRTSSASADDAAMKA